MHSSVRLTAEGGICITSLDCAMNGECMKSSPRDAQAPGVCNCFSGWKGGTCEVLDLLPIDPEHAGLKLSNRDSSSWGGSVVFRNGLYHMFASEIVNNCGLYSWNTNSQIIRAVSKFPNGPYKKVEVVLAPFAHDANVVQSPSGEVVLFTTAKPGVQPYDCRNQTNISGDSSLMESTTVAAPKDSYMLWAPQPEGPWSSPILVLNSTIWNLRLLGEK